MAQREGNCEIVRMGKKNYKIQNTNNTHGKRGRTYHAENFIKIFLEKKYTKGKKITILMNLK